MEFENRGIKCNIFWDAESIIKKTHTKIKEARGVKEKQYYAQDILLEAEALLLCPNYSAGNSDCVSCHSISRRYIQEYKYLAKDERKKVAKRY